MLRQRYAGQTIPKDFKELHDQYDQFIRDVLAKKDTLKKYQEDIYSYVWLKLLEAKLLERFDQFARGQTPKVLTALGVCEFLGISWNQWLTAMWSHHKGREKKGKLVCGFWMPTPINLAEFETQGLTGLFSKTALFSFEDVIQITLEEKVLKNGKTRGPFSIMGREVKDGVVIGGPRPEGYLKFPMNGKPTVPQFRNYLKRSVLNHYANYLRTRKRRHQEEPQSPKAEKNEDWVSTLQDTHSVEIETLVALAEAKKLLSEVLVECVDGYQLCKSIEVHESEIFMSLDNGSTLLQALYNTNLPPKVCRSVVDTMRPLAAY